ncbi:MAG: hypothetical protein AAGA91_08625 [Pseudomonadota bacterium]
MSESGETPSGSSIASKKQLILHIGLGKTGTTMLQEFLWANRRVLTDLDIDYPTYGAVACAHHTLSPFLPDEVPEWTTKPVSEWAPVVARTSCSTLLVSSELMIWASAQDVAEFCKQLQQWFELRIVVYLRRQDDAIMSNYNQLVKVGSQRRRLDDVLTNMRARFDYRRLLEPWVNALGVEALIVRPYERDQFYQGDLCADFLRHALGINLDGRFTRVKRDANPRFPDTLLELLRRLYVLFDAEEQVDEFSQWLNQYASELPHRNASSGASSALLSPPQRRDVLADAEATNQWIARELLQREDALLFYDSPPDPGQPWIAPEFSAAEYRAVFSELCEHHPALAERLAVEVGRHLASTNIQRRNVARFFLRQLPAKQKALAKHHRRAGSSTERPPSDGSVPSVVLILPELPANQHSHNIQQLKRLFGPHMLPDYDDAPVNKTTGVRVSEALRNALTMSGYSADGDRGVCIHGHFMPVKYRLVKSQFPKYYVTWVSEPVGRLYRHYRMWRSQEHPGPGGGLRTRMKDEDWSFEEFALRPELRNICSKLLWGIPLKRFDFIGISDEYATEFERFCDTVFGVSAAALGLEPPMAVERETDATNPALRSRIERFHARDMAMYQYARRRLAQPPARQTASRHQP